jgi:hypothetical protein
VSLTGHLPPFAVAAENSGEQPFVRTGEPK